MWLHKLTLSKSVFTPKLLNPGTAWLCFAWRGIMGNEKGLQQCDAHAVTQTSVLAMCAGAETEMITDVFTVSKSVINEVVQQNAVDLYHHICTLFSANS